MLEREGFSSVEAFEPSSYEQAIEAILLDNENYGLTWDKLLDQFGKKFWGPAGLDPSEIMTPQRIEKIDTALRKVGCLKKGMPSMDIPNLWFAKKTHGPTWVEENIMGIEDRYAR